jgi:diguanylate cyclase (GGDEF)-like protein
MHTSLSQIKGVSEDRLSTRIAIVASTLTVLFVLMLGGSSYYVTRVQMTEGINNALKNTASLLASRLDSSLGSTANTLSSLKQSPLVMMSLMDSLTRTTSLEPYLQDFFSINGIPVEISLTDSNGNIVAGSRSAVKLNSKWSKPVLEEGVSFVSIEERSTSLYLLFAEPVFYINDLSPEGALVSKIDLTYLLEDLNTINGAEEIYLLHRGRPILQNDARENSMGHSSSLLTHVASLRLPGLFADLDLAVEVRAPEETLTQPLNRLSLIYILLGIATLAVVVVLSILAGTYLAWPLRELEKVASNVVASGSFDHRFKGSGYTEVTLLGQTFNQMLESLGSAHKQVMSMANRDVLTGLANRALFQTRLRAGIRDARRSHQVTGILILDLDKFKDINDTMGHPVGDELLKQVSNRLSKQTRATDTVARLGGDEFAIIATHLSKADDAGILGQTIITSMTTRPFKVFDYEIHVSTSIGIAICPTDGNDPDRLLSNADMALYKAKAEGRGNTQFYDAELNTTAQKKKHMESCIRKALEQSDFCLHYQPKVDLQTGRIAGVEALVRLQGENGLIYPGEFIQIAEDSGLIVPLGEWILREACLQKIIWEESGLPPFSVAVNLSAVQLRQDHYIERLIQVIKDTGIDPASLQIEITESALIDDMETIGRRLGYFQEMGISLAIDDIGTGYSSLSNLKLLSVDVLKIDQSFIRDIEIDANDAAITRAIVQLGRSLDLIVVAEGVEFKAQEVFLQLQGCHQSQGFLHSRALSGPELADWVRKKGSDHKPHIPEHADLVITQR